MTRLNKLYLSVSLAVAASASVPASLAQDNSTGGLEEVVVVARKTQESLQEVPIAVSVLQGKKLTEDNIFDLSQIVGRVPSFNYQSQSATGSEISIRGIGTVRSFGATADSSVGTFLDEVYIGRRGSATPPVFDLERIEVLRGPQGHLFGKNVVGGALSMISAKPQFERGGSVYAGVGDYDQIQSGGHITGPLGDDLAARFAFYQNRRDGYAQNIVFGEELEDQEAYAGRLSFAWNISDTARLDLIMDASKERGNGQSRHAVDDPTVEGPGTVTPFLRSQDPRTNESPYDQWSEKQTSGITARLEWDIGDLTATYVAAYRRGDGYVRWTQTGNTAPPTLTDSTLTSPEDYTGLTQELRLASSQDQRFRWLAGLYYLKEDTDKQTRNKAKSFLPGGPGSLRDILDGDYNIVESATSEDFAIFADTNFDITDTLTLNIGGRFTKNEKENDVEAIVLDLGPPGSLVPTAPVTGPYEIQDSDSWSEFTPRVALDWRFTDDVLFYGSAAKGFKGGGWQGGAGTALSANIAFDPETALTYEVGMKSEWADSRLRVNVAAFRTDFEDLQVELLDDVNLVLVVANAADAEISGLEVEVESYINDNFSLYGSASFLDAEYKDYIDPLRGIDYSGNQIQRTPEYQYNIGMDFNFPLSDRLDLSGNVNYSYLDDFFYGPQETNFEPGYGLLDARLSLGTNDGDWSVTAWGRNLTDELYRISIITFVGDEFGSYGAPRTYGLTFTKNF